MRCGPRNAHPEGLNGFTGALETRDGGDRAQATSWYRATRPVIAGEEPSPTVRLAWASDFTANSGNFLDLSRWSAINADLTINLARVPVGEWTGVVARAWYVEDGVGPGPGRACSTSTASSAPAPPPSSSTRSPPPTA